MPVDLEYPIVRVMHSLDDCIKSKITLPDNSTSMDALVESDYGT